MLLKDLKKSFCNELYTIYGKNEAESLFFITTEFYLNISRLQFILEPNYDISKDNCDKIVDTLQRLKQQEPIQYILGETEFYGLNFKVNPHVLIPRQETEELVALVLKQIKLKNPDSKIQDPIRILDIGTGSGCIAISLAKHLPNAKVYAVDVSKAALEVAKKNAELNNVDIEFLEHNILNSTSNNFFPFGKGISQKQKGLFDVIVSNPPYVRHLEKEEIKPNVLKNEPHLALFVENDNPLVFYKAITEFAKNHLKPNGHLYFEINQYLGEATKHVLLDADFHQVELHKDLNGNDRMLMGIKRK